MTRNQLPVVGGCLCGAVRYESTKPPIAAGYCHCSLCRKAYGNFNAAMIRLGWEDFHYTEGEPGHYRSSDLATRSFCRDCGSPVLFSYDEQDTLFLLAGTMDYPEDWPFDTEYSWGHAFVDDKVSWVEIRDGLPQHKHSVGFMGEAKNNSVEEGRKN